MARYIDAEQFRGKHEVAEINGKLYSVIPYADIVYAPTADVAPKSEVAREIFEEIEKKIKTSITNFLEEINKEYIQDTPLYDRCSGVVFALRNIEDFLAELKKKYTEGENGNS